MACIPIRDLKDTGNISQMCQASLEPITITKNSNEDMVIMSAEVYNRIRLFTVYENLREAEHEILSNLISYSTSRVGVIPVET